MLTNDRDSSAYLSLDNRCKLRVLSFTLFRAEKSHIQTDTGFSKAQKFALPPPPEQTAIVRYLDYVDRRIGRYVAAKRKLIALLEEEKQAVVNRAVTRGLDPNVRLKPSGVEWLGDVPEHWEVRRLSQVSGILRGKFTHRPRKNCTMDQLPFIQLLAT